VDLIAIRTQVFTKTLNIEYKGGRGNPPTHFQPIEISIEVSLTALNLFRFEVRGQAIMGREKREERVGSLRSLKSCKRHEYTLNLFISRLAQSRDEENLKAAYEEISRAGMVGSMIMMLFGSQIM
jgi:hypothetical protein